MKKLMVGLAIMATASMFAQDDTCPVNPNVRGHENTEWSIGYAFHLTDAMKGLPRVLLVGDSICNGYQWIVQKQLEGRMNVSYWVSSYCVTSPGYLRLLGFYLDETKYDVIHFNNGLHSLGTPTAEYAKGIAAAIKLIREKQPQARLVWVSSTPLKDPAATRKVMELNAAAAKVAEGLETDDLFSLLNPLDREKNWSDNFHHKQPTQKMTASQVSACVCPGAVAAQPDVELSVGGR